MSARYSVPEITTNVSPDYCRYRAYATLTTPITI